jgi:hypothetical protein
MKNEFPFLLTDSCPLNDIRLFLIFKNLDVSGWTPKQKERFILYCYHYDSVVCYNDGLAETIELDSFQGINTALVPLLCDRFGFETIHDVLTDLENLLQWDDKGYDVLHTSATWNWMEFITELEVFDRSTPNVFDYLLI